ncbi:hypothetical protein [Halorussus halophilus]|uniref:hypothetical protein n=1 Tax=Halorussus halophilus TaxID=2650975 RepID=UPI0013015A1F|nr:hypothetical protein [Halorussus halophilus]
MSGIRLPTSTDDLRLIARTVRLVVTIPAYAALTLFASAVGLSVFVLSQNVNLVRNVVLNGALPLDARLTVLVNLYPFVGTAFRPMTEVLLVAAGLLTGVNLAMLTYHLKRERVSVKSGSGSIFGMVLGTLGAGCAACGSALIAGVFSLFGAAGALTMLPLEGAEFTILALLMLVFSIYWLADGMRGGEIAGCPVDIGGNSGFSRAD